MSGGLPSNAEFASGREEETVKLLLHAFKRGIRISELSRDNIIFWNIRWYAAIKGNSVIPNQSFLDVRRLKTPSSSLELLAIYENAMESDPAYSFFLNPAKCDGSSIWICGLTSDQCSSVDETAVRLLLHLARLSVRLNFISRFRLNFSMFAFLEVCSIPYPRRRRRRKRYKSVIHPYEVRTTLRFEEVSLARGCGGALSQGGGLCSQLLAANSQDLVLACLKKCEMAYKILPNEAVPMASQTPKLLMWKHALTEFSISETWIFSGAT